jgi:hypothetical protein
MTVFSALERTGGEIFMAYFKISQNLPWTTKESHEVPPDSWCAAEILTSTSQIEVRNVISWASFLADGV